MARKDFDKVVEEAIAELPDDLRQALKNLSIIVEDKPDARFLQEMDIPADETLFGLYTGVPLPERSYGEDPYLPDQIFIFRQPLEKEFKSPDRLREQIRITLVHELAHYFGFDEDYLAELGLD